VIFSYKPKPGAEEAIYRLISDITISMKGTDYLKLPELVINEVPVKLSEKEMKTLDTMKRDLITTVKGEEITAPMQRLFQESSCRWQTEQFMMIKVSLFIYMTVSWMHWKT
jgi:hypothetical protein